MTANTEPKSTASHSIQVAHELLRRIREGELGVGDRLPSERSLTAEMEVSRPIVREGLRMLAMLDLVDIQVGRGAFVKSVWVGPSPFVELNVDELVDVVDAREIIEQGALRLAAQRATDRDRSRVEEVLDGLTQAVENGEDTSDLDVSLHREIVRSAHSAALLRMWSELDTRIKRTVELSPFGTHMSTELLELHLTLANGVLTGDIESALDASSNMYKENRLFLIQKLGGSRTHEPDA